jgi:DNA-binding MarR family transcriptional regulator
VREIRLLINTLGNRFCMVEAPPLLEAAIPMSLCVEFSARRRGTIREGEKRRERRSNGTLNMTPLSGYVGYALRRAQGVIFADFNHALAELGLRPGQFAVLLMIDQNPGASQSSVSAALGIQKANFVATIADLEKRGLVRRRRSHTDGRTYSLGLTPRGRAQLQRAAELQSVHEARVTAQIGNEGRQQLLALLDRLSALPSAWQLK